MKKQEMIDFIGRIDKYPTMNSWNNTYGYSYNVKIYHLPLTKDEMDKMYEVISDESLANEFYSTANDIIRDHEEEMNDFWNEDRQDPLNHISELYPEHRHKSYCNRCFIHTWYEPGQKCKVDGCEGELVEIKYSENFIKNLRKRQFEIAFNGKSGGYLVLYKWNGYNYGGSTWVFTEDELKEMSKVELSRVYKILKIFEHCRDELIKLCKSVAELEIIEETEEVVTEVKRKRFSE